LGEFVKKNSIPTAKTYSIGFEFFCKLMGHGWEGNRLGT
jgi:hypothetical protein